MTVVNELIIEEEDQDDQDDRDEARIASYLVAECGTTNTAVTLFDVAGGSFQILARGVSQTTAGSPWRDVNQGILNAIDQIEANSERALLSRGKTVRRSPAHGGAGVDYFGTVVSAAPPIKTLLVGLLDDVSLASGRRALNSIYSQEVDCFSLADNRSQQEQLTAMLRHQPDLIFIVGGTDGGAEHRLLRLVETVAFGLQLMSDSQLPTVIYAGNREMRPKVEAALVEYCDLLIADNVRPSLDHEFFDQAIALFGEYYATHQVSKLSGFETISAWSDLPVIPVAHGFGAICEFIATLRKGRVLGVDIGSNNVTILAAEPDYVYLDVNSDLGLGSPLAKLWNHVEISEVANWAGLVNKQDQVVDYVANKAIWPGTIPMDQTQLFIEQSIARAILKHAATKAYACWNWSSGEMFEPIKSLILRGAIMSNSAYVRRLVLMILDALQPAGIFSVLVDRFGVLAAMGLLSFHNPHLVVQILQGQGKERLGWVIAPKSSAKEGHVVLRLSVTVEDQPTQQLEIRQGDVDHIPLRRDQRARVIAEPSPRTDIGAGPGKSRTLPISGGLLGILIDARGRPIPNQYSMDGLQ